MLFHSKSEQEVLEELKTDAAAGLSSAEVKTRREKHGENKLREKKKKTAFGKL